MIPAFCLAAVLSGVECVSPEAEGRLGRDITPWAITFPLQEAPQDPAAPYRKSWQKHGPFVDPGYIFAGILVRETNLRGDWYDDGLDEDDYGDLFEPGFGFLVELGGMIEYRQDWRVGLYLAFGMDTYEGDEVRTTTGVRLEPDDMTIYTGLAGFRAMLHFAEIMFVEAHIAGGATYSDEVRARMGTIEGELFDRSLKPVVEVGARFGIELVYIQFEVGAGYRLQDGPEPGENASDNVDPELMGGFFIELGGALRF